MAREFRLPDLGEGITEGQIVRVLCAEGDTVAEDQSILEVETDKAAVEIPSPFAGTATKVHVEEGQTVAVGEVLVTFDDGDGTGDKKEAAPEEEKKEEPKAAPAQAPPPAPAKQAPASPAADAPPTQPAARRTRAAAAPAVRKLARELGVDIDAMTGSGPGGRVLKADVERSASAPAAHVPTATQPVPTVIEGTPGQDNWGPVKRQKLSQIRKTIARQMSLSASTIPHVTQTDEADVTVLDSVRRAMRGENGTGPRVTAMAFLIKAIAQCLRTHPIFNANFDAENEEVVYKEYVNIGIAVDSPRGLVVPSIRGADRLSVLGIAAELTKLAEKVRNVQFTIDELRGGTFTVTNYGAIGGIWGTPIINHPEVAILGVGRSTKRPQIEGGVLTERTLMPLSLSFDHRAADGAQAARFLNDVIALLGNPGMLLIN